jgi:hypothetical protein
VVRCLGGGKQRDWLTSNSIDNRQQHPLVVDEALTRLRVAPPALINFCCAEDAVNHLQRKGDVKPGYEHTFADEITWLISRGAGIFTAGD